MGLEDCFDFERVHTKFGEVERIRVKGSRIAIEYVVDEFKAGLPPEEIREHYPTLSLAEVYATIAYYLDNRAAVEAYLERSKKIADAHYQEYLQQEPPEVVKRLRALRENPKEVERLRELRRRQLEDGKAAS